MPYFLYRISPVRTLTPIGSFSHYREARERARAMRADSSALGGDTVKIVFAADAAEAEALLKMRRERIVHEDD